MLIVLWIKIDDIGDKTIVHKQKYKPIQRDKYFYCFDITRLCG